LWFDKSPKDWTRVTLPSALDLEMRSANLWTWPVKDVLYVAFEVDGIFEYDEMDADVVVRDGVTVVTATEYTDGKATTTDEFFLGTDGLLTRRVHRAVNGSDAPNYTQSFGWSKVGDVSCVASMDIHLEDANPTEYVVTLRYADVARMHLLTSYELTFLAKDAAPRKFSFQIDDLVVDDRKVALPTPWKHVGNVSADAAAAIDRMRSLVERPEDRGLTSFRGEVVPIGAESRARPTFEFTPPGRWHVRTPPALRDELSRANVEDRIATEPLYAAVDPAYMIDLSEYDAEVADRDGNRVILVTQYRDGRISRRREFDLDSAGLVTRQRCTSAGSDDRRGLTQTYGWSKVGDRYTITSLDGVFEDATATSFSIAIESAEFGGFHLPISWSTTYATGPKSMRTFRFYVDNAVVNGAKVTLPRPWIHESRVSPEARAMIDRCERLVDRPADHGFASATFDLVTTGAKTPARTSYEVTAPGKVATKAQVGPSWGASDPRLQQLILETAFDPLEILSLRHLESADAEVVERDGRRVLVVTSFRDGAISMDFEIGMDDDGLPASVISRDMSESGDPSKVVTMRPTWTSSGERRRVEKLVMAMKLSGVSLNLESVLRRAPLAGMDLIASIDVVVSTVATGPLKFAVCVENLVVNGKKVDVPAAPARPNHVTPEAQAAMDRFAAITYRPSDHGLKTVSGELVAGGAGGLRRHRFSFVTPSLVAVTLANGFDQDSPSGKAATAEMTTPLRMAYTSLVLAGDAEFDADRVTKDGSDVLSVTCYRDGAKSQEQEVTLDAAGLIRTSRVRALDASGATTTITDTTFTWGRIGDQWRVVGLDAVSRPPSDTGKWLVRNVTTFRYAEVDGFEVLAAFSIGEATPAKPGSMYTLHVERLVLNGKPADLPRPVHASVVPQDAKTAIDRFEKLVYRAAEHGLVTASGVFQPLGLTFEVKAPARAVMTLPPGEKPGSPRAAMQTALADPFASALDGPRIHGPGGYDASFADRGGERRLVVTEFDDDLPVATREISFDADGLPSSVTISGLGPSAASSDYRYTWTDAGEGRLLATEEVWDPTTAGAPHMTVAFGYSDLGGVRVPTSLRLSFAGGVADGKTIAFQLSEATVNGRVFTASATPPAGGGK
jgi:hypothetical protein